MTYKEAYMSCETKKELEQMVAKDITVAQMINPDRIKHIQEAAEEVANDKFKDY